MIELPMGLILALLVGVPTGGVAVAALYYNFRGMHRSSRERASIYECARCGHVYTFTRSRPMDRCPRCNHLNDAVRT